MDFSIYRNAWRLFKDQFGKLASFTFSVIVVFFASIFALLFISGFDMGLSGILLFAFVFIPLFFSLQIVVAKVSAGKQIEYNELYSTYKLYFLKQNRGVYSIIRNLIFSLMIMFLCIYLSLTLYDFFNQGVIDEIAKTLVTSSENVTYTPESYDQFVSSILHMPGYLYYLICFLSIPFLFFFSRMEKNFMLPYFNMVIAVPSYVSHAFNKTLLRTNNKDIQKVTRPANLFFALAFLIGFIGAGSVACFFAEYIEYIELIIIIALAGGLLTSFIFVVPLLITYCFVADSLHATYLNIVHQKMIETSQQIEADDNIDEEKKEALREMLNTLKNDIEKEEPTETDDSSEK